MTLIRPSRAFRVLLQPLTSLCLLLTGAALCGTPLNLAAQTSASSRAVPSRITTPVNDANRVTLKGATPASARAEFDQGAVPDNTPAEHIHLLLKRSDAQEATLKQLIAAQHDPNSAQYHQWLSGAQFGALFGPSQQDLDQVRSWLQGQGFKINKTSTGNIAIDFSGTAGMVRTAFHTELHSYQSNGVTYHANNADPSIPVALSPVIAGVVSLNDIKPISNMKVAGSTAYNTKDHSAKPLWNSTVACYNPATNVTGTCIFYLPAPADLAVQYGLTGIDAAGTTGTGETVGIIGDSNIDVSIVQNYRALFGLKNLNNLPQVIVDGNDPGQNGDSLESFLDVEAVSAMAPDATVNLYISAGSVTTSGLINAIVRAVDDNAADVLSVSYGTCEQNLGPAGNAFVSEMWQQAAAQGQSVLVAAGDGATDGCDNFNYTAQATAGLSVNGLASTPYNTAVGGTDFYYSKYAQGSASPAVMEQLESAWGSQTTFTPALSLVAPLPEQPWNDGFGLNINGDPNAGYDIVGGGGGASSCVTGTNIDPTTGAIGNCTAGYPKPSWQSGKGVPADGVRDLPDVALFAAAGENLSFWPICTQPTDCLASQTPVGVSAVVTAVGGTSAATPAMAGITALLDQTEKGRQGNINYKLYAIATQYPNSFNDVTVGSNNIPCVQGSPDCSLDTNGDGFYTLQHYAAGPGYDQASGLGSVNAANLFANWNKVTVSSGTTKTALSLAKTSFVHGTAVAATATVTSSGGTPTGSVVMQTNLIGQVGQGSENEVGTQFSSGTIQLASGTGTGSISSFPGGSYSITGVYSGDGSFATSSSSPVAVTITPETSTNTISGAYYDINFNPGFLQNGGAYNYGDTYYFDATVAGKSGLGVPTGQVTFMDGKTAIGTANFNQGSVAELLAGNLAPGSHSLTAVYAGDPSFAASTSSPFTLTVAKGTPSVVYTGYNGIFTQVPVSAGQPLQVSAVVQAGQLSAVPTGTLTFTLGNLPPQTATLVPEYPGGASAAAYVFLTPPAAGTYTLTVAYSGDANYNASGLAYPTQIKVTAPTGASTTTTLSANTSTVSPNGLITLTAQVTGSIPNVVPTGYVGFMIDGIPITYVVPVDASGFASYTQSGGSITTGSHVLNATYIGDSNYAPSFSNTLPVNSNQGDYSVTASNQNLTITSGNSSTTTISVASVPSIDSETAGLTGPTSLTCTVSSPSVLCTLSASSVTLTADGAQQNVTATINTRILTARNEAPTGGIGRSLAGGGVALALLLLFIPGGRKLSSRLMLGLVMSFALLGVGTLGCSKSDNSGSSQSNSPAGTNAPAGTYNVLISANASGIQHTLLLHVKVQ